MPKGSTKHFAKHSAGTVSRLPHGFGGLVSRAVRGAVHVGDGHLGASVRGALRASGRSVFGGVPKAAPSDLADPATQQLKILQDIYNLMTGPGISVIVKNPDLQAKFG